MNDLNVNNAPVVEVNNTELLSVTLEKLGEKLGEYKPYDSQLPIAEIEGTRIVKCLYQVSKTGANAGKKVAENSFVRIPTKHISEEMIVARIAELTPYVLSYLQSIEDSIIKEEHKSGLLNLYVDGLSIDKIIEALEASEAGARLTKDKVNEWFTLEVRDNLVLLFSDKMGLGDNPSEQELDKLGNIIAAYRKKFESLAGGKSAIKEEDCIAMIAVIKSCEADKSIIGSRFIAKLDKLAKKEEELLFTL
jgi:hypothetical protein